MRTTSASLFTILLLAFFAGCATENKPTKTGLELQSFQRREFETPKKVVFASVLSVFQDLGYIVESADLNTGFITAKSPTKARTGWGENMGRKHFMTDTKATAFIEELRTNNTSIRLNFVETEEQTSGVGDKIVQDNPIEDPKFYEDVFAKIQQAIFVRSATQ